MNQEQELKRESPRRAINTIFRIYSNIAPCKYTVQLKNISKKGAFIQSRFLPNVNEIITYCIVDNTNNEQFMGNARVVWCKSDCSSVEKGFGIELETELDDNLIESLKRS